jgi:hypothetical protein
MSAAPHLCVFVGSATTVKEKRLFSKETGVVSGLFSFWDLTGENREIGE